MGCLGDVIFLVPHRFVTGVFQRGDGHFGEIVQVIDIASHDLVIENTSSTASSSAILLANTTSGHEIYSNEFQNCSVACIYIPGTGVGEFSQNTFSGTTAARAIVYGTGNYPAPTFSSASMTSYTAWQLALTTPDSATGDVEFYIASGDDIVPLGSVLENQTGSVTSSQNFSDRLPSGTYYALFTGDSTSDFTDASEATGVSVDWSDETNFGFGDYTACNATWFIDSTNGQSAGDYDGDGIANGTEDADNDCAVASTETNPALADSDSDGYCDSSTAVSSDTETCTASDNCPLVANADQADEDGDLTGDLCDADYTANNPPVAATLVYPNDEATDMETELTFRWQTTTDPDGDAVTYQLFVCEDADFTDCNALYDTATAFHLNKTPRSNKMLAFLGGTMLVGAIVSRRRKTWLMFGLVMIISFSFVSCGGSGGGGTTTTTELSYTVSDLNPETTYYWKVAATDANSDSTPSEIREFVTEAASAVTSISYPY